MLLFHIFPNTYNTKVYRDTNKNKSFIFKQNSLINVCVKCKYPKLIFIQVNLTFNAYHCVCYCDEIIVNLITTRRIITHYHDCNLVLLFYCLMYFLLFVEVLCLSLFYNALLCVHSSFAIEEKAGCFTIIVLQMFYYYKCYVGLPRVAVDLSAVCDCGIPLSYSLTFPLCCSGLILSFLCKCCLCRYQTK